MLESLNTGKFEYKRLSLEEQKSRGILGRLAGVIADTTEATRNGRKYSSELWENVFENPIVQEKIANHCLFGELGHPLDREEVDMEKVAICLAEQPKKGKDGKLYGVFDILSTPNGKILKSLCDYGCNIGVSSRGTGDLMTDDDGNEAVDPETYNMECWDAVLVPAVESARLKYVTESLDTKKRNKTLRQRLSEQLEKASEDDRKIMEEALTDLDINLTESAKEYYKDQNGDILSYEEAKEVVIDEKGISEEEFEVDPSWYLDDAGFRHTEAPEEQERDGVDDFDDAWHSGNIREKVDADLQGIKPIKSDKWEVSLPKGAVKKVNDIVLSMEEADFDLLNDNAFDAYMEKDKEALAVVRKVLRKYHLPMWALQVFVENWEEFDESLREKLNKEECNSENCADKEEENDEEVVNNESEIVAQLQESLIQNKKLADDNLSLQEKLSVCNAKEVKLEEELKQKTNAVINLSDKAKEVKPLTEKVNKLTESLAKKDEVIKANRSRLESMVEKKKELSKQLDESLFINENLQSQVDNLNDQLESLNSKLNESKETIKKYQKAYASLKESYLASKADAYGIKKEAVKANLNESYTVKDIDRICEDLANERKAMSKLPFRINEGATIKASQSKDYSIKMRNKGSSNDDDYVSDSLLRIIK